VASQRPWARAQPTANKLYARSVCDMSSVLEMVFGRRYTNSLTYLLTYLLAKFLGTVMLHSYSRTTMTYIDYRKPFHSICIEFQSNVQFPIGLYPFRYKSGLEKQGYCSLIFQKGGRQGNGAYTLRFAQFKG